LRTSRITTDAIVPPELRVSFFVWPATTGIIVAANLENQRPFGGPRALQQRPHRPLQRGFINAQPTPT
jgi:hypothetical protein